MNKSQEKKNQQTKTQTSDNNDCKFCNGTGEMPADERDRYNHWHRGVKTEKCICQIE